ncbi:hypothetical protein XENOCAPTIV_001005 [Xenoophorus captivus]|uniref:Uncharacterized protein n=1 Tax=Xenoophorus captivus TaxID=1517983 RepID=A0ABV0SDD1_9TELE
MLKQQEFYLDFFWVRPTQISTLLGNENKKLKLSQIASIHPLSTSAYECVVGGQRSFGERQDTPLTVRHTAQTHTLERLINLSKIMFYEYPEITHTCMGKTCKLL